MASSSDDLTLRMRATGARNAARDVDGTRRSVDKLGTSSRNTAKHATLLGKATGGLVKPFHHLRSEVTGAAKGFVAAGLAFGSVEGIKKSIETTDSLVKTTVRLHQQFGLTTESASGLAGVLQARDLQPQALQMGLTSLAKQLIAAEHGTKKAQGAFRIFGIDARDVHAAINSKDGLAKTFETVTDRMTEMPGGARKAALGQQLLGRASRGLAPLMQEGALGLQQQMKWAKEYGVTLDDHAIGSVEDMVAAQTQAQYAMLGLQIQLGRFAAPMVAKANVALADIVRSFREGRPEGTKFSKTVYEIGTDLKPVGHELLVIGGYLKDHPKLLRAAAAGYIAYRLKLLKLISIGPKAYLQGLAAGRAYSLGFERGATKGPAAARFAGVGRLIGLAIAAGIIVELPDIESAIADALLGKHNAFSDEAHKQGFRDLLGPLLPESTTTGKGDVIPRKQRGRRRGRVDPAVAYFRRHRRELTPAIVDTLTPGQQRALGVHTAPNAAGGEIVVNAKLYLSKDGKKEIARTVHREAINKKSTG